ncbi:flavin-containing amine oxidase [Microthyrium microscopicum]|uniref:Flavin-containing amine oxidase n=1 Tax=Microthyrium microscopicum TaxID=703497 RepID=A0A6A6UNR9_9PEZI|nr:flavin-containing amine oxidase [Microthyrium microscopicum]
MYLSTLVAALVSLFFISSVSAAACPVNQPPSDPGNIKDLFLRKILDQSIEYGNFSHAPSPGPLKVGIVGAGVAGLYAGILLDSLNIDYDILEASERIGGRIFTYRFDEAAWDASKPGEPNYYDYYDVGAMRFPGMPWMDRVIGSQNTSIISYVNSKIKSTDRIQQIPYIFTANNTYRLFNDQLVYNQVNPSAATFKVLTSDGGPIPNNDRIATLNTETALTQPLQSLIDVFTKYGFDAGFNNLMQYDNISLREYLLQNGYSSRDVDWMETIDDATTHFDAYSLSQAVLEQWIFNSAPLDSWTAIEGGMDRITYGMTQILKNKPLLNKWLLNKSVSSLVGQSDGQIKTITRTGEERTYAHIINTVPLGVMQNMDMSTLNLDYNKTFAIRKLQYDPAGKIGMSFKTRWWENDFKGGQSYSDLSIRRCVYPSYGVNTTNAAGAMIASYTWGQDSSRLGSFYNSDDARDYITNVTLRQLAAMNNVTVEFLHAQLVDTHLWDWYAHEYAVGAFAMFGPAEFSTVMPSLMKPAFEGKMHFAGEALSSGHAWIIGAVNSAYRTVMEILAVEKRDDLIKLMVQTWGIIDEVDMGWYVTK